MNQRGASVIELVVASGVMLLVLSGIMSVLQDGLAATPVLEESADLHQRARVALDAIASDVSIAAAGARGAPLSSVAAAIVPRAGNAGAGAAAPDVLTVRYAPPNGASGRLREPLLPGAQTAALDLTAACPRNATACGFVSRSTAILLGEDGQADVVSVDGISSGALTISDVDVPRVASYPAGTPIVQVVEVTYSVDTAARQLRRREGAGTFPLADHVTHLAFEFFDATSAPLALASFTDGPFRGEGRMAFDADLLRIRTLRVTVRLEAGTDAFRGTDARLFARPGSASGARVIPDILAVADITARNGAR